MIFKKQIPFWLFFFAVCLSLPLSAAHIIGGEITYECLGGGDYRITMKIYRDCGGGGAPFDSPSDAPFPGSMSIFKGNSALEFRNVTLPAPVINSVPPNLSNPCLIAPPNVCVEEGIYTFEINLPVSDDSYYLVYQRCCRNNTISNIVAPGESGATYFTEITKRSQQLCNNSPVFKDFPPIVICAGEPINFDHAAVDPDGDLLTYELCTPFLGGGTDQNNPFNPNGVAPDPDAPPPYQPVNFVGPLYSFSNPLVGSPPLAINMNTGFLTGTPTVQGQFVVGVCVKEWRGGQVLSEVRRDFQFNIAKCDPTVVADVLEDDTVSLQGAQYYLVRSCGDLTVTFDNQSYQQSYIISHRWEFDINGSLVTETEDWDATITFPDTGTYFGKLYLNPGTTCADTAYIQTDVLPDITSDFIFVYDTCVAGPVSFTDRSFSDAGPGSVVDWRWSFGDGRSDTLQNPHHIYLQPGTMPASLTVTDLNGCTETKIIQIPYYPVPEFLIVAPSEYIGCLPASIFFDNLSYPVNEEYQVTWDFGDGEKSNEISPTHIYDELGVYTVSLEIVSPLGCFTDTIWPNLITVLASPVADFSYSPQQVSNLQPTVEFTDESIDAVKWKWNFGKSGTSTQQNPIYSFPDTGLQEIKLVVFHQSGCTDTTIQMLDVIPEVRYYLPNAFTPNGDGSNDGFRGNGEMEGATNFVLTIWNRYGEKLFETSDPFEAWNGRKNNTGELAPQGVYVVAVTYRDPRGKQHDLRGYATLIK
jgi:gliding motility-associated-like protein